MTLPIHPSLFGHGVALLRTVLYPFACALFSVLLSLCTPRISNALEHTAGHAGGGSANSPSGSMLPAPAGSSVLRLGSENDLVTCMLDGAAGYGYVGTSDGRLVMWSMGDGTAAPVRIGALTLGTTAITCAIADLSARQLYICSGSMLYQVALGQGSALPQLRHSLALPITPTAIALDLARDQVYLASSRGLSKVSRGTSSIAPGILAYQSIELYSQITCILQHPTRPEILLAGNSSPACVFKLDLGSTTATPTLIGKLVLKTSEDKVTCGVLDAAGDYAYFGTRTIPGRVIKVAFNGAGLPPTRTHALVLPAGEDQLTAAFANPVTGHAWFGTTSVRMTTNTLPVKLIKVGMVGGAAAPVRISVGTMPLGVHDLGSAMIDTARQQAWLGTVDPGRVVKCSLGAGITAPAYIAHVTLDTIERNVSALAIDELHGYAYAAIGGDTHSSMVGYGPGRVVKIRLGGPNEPPRRVSELQLQAHDTKVSGLGVDSERGLLYIVSANHLIKSRLGEGEAPMQRVATLTISDDSFYTAAFDFDAGYAWLPGPLTRLHKVALGEGDSEPIYLGYATQNSLPNASMNRILLDNVRKRGYCWTTDYATGGCYLFKFSLGENSELPSCLNHMSFDYPDVFDGLIDIAQNRAYFGRAGLFQQVDLGIGNAPPFMIESPYFRNIVVIAPFTFDPDSRRIFSAYASYQAPYGNLLQRFIDAPIDPPDLNGVLSLPSSCSVIALDRPRQDVYAHTKSGKLYKFTTGHYDVLRLAKIKLQATGELVRVGMQVHRGGGHARLALYRTQPDGTHTLAWESQATTVTTGTSLLEIPVAAGVPASAVLAAGDYLLGVQLDHPTATLAYVGTAPSGQSAYLLRSFGPAPATLGAAGQADAPIPTSDLWSAYFITRGGTGVESRIWTAYDEAPIPSSSLAP